MEDYFFNLLIEKGSLVVVCGWFMFRMEKKLDKLAEALENLKH
jgi:hypothetical protein